MELKKKAQRRWGREIAAWKAANDSAKSEAQKNCNHADDDENLAEFNATPVIVMDVSRGNFEHADGEAVAIMTIARKELIEHIAFVTRDAKLTITKLLIGLASGDDEFAQRLLDHHFPCDNEGNFKWPDEPFNFM